MLESITLWCRGLSTGAFALLLTVLLALAGTAFYEIWRALRRSRIIEDTPTSRLRSAAQGYVELEGHGALMGGLPIVAPLSGIACLWYRYRIERRRSITDLRGRGWWHTVQKGVSDGLFRLEDSTGACIVDPDRAEVIPSLRRVWYGGSDAPALVLGTHSGGRPSFAEYRYTEERLMPGPLCALGWFKTVGDADDSLDADVAALLRQWKGDRAALLTRFDRNADGQIDVEEWARVREAALQQVMKERAERAAEPETNTLVRPPVARQPYLLVAGTERAAAHRYRVRSQLALAGFGLCVAGLLWALGARLS
ncbi:MAG: hypothetical protein B7Z66_06355 [Chromatiales bacterium 21-64-14]|nr:MAG: hypothetical protein B7Z66_06355 [Chromatiales bacterium 21-64-14]HQU15866.1 GIDE domain-containing protein [Gammaproteobacteria bacterium]